MCEIVIIVPCFDEAARLDVDAFVQFVDRHHDVELLMVDDGSRDRTGDILRRLAARRPARISTLSLARNVGKGEAVRAGLLRAIRRQPTPRAVGFWDADLATPLDAIRPFIDVLRERPEVEMVFGARVNMLGRHVRRDLRRHWVGRIFATLASHALHLAIYDTQCGAKLFRVTPQVEDLLDRPFRSRWIFDVELLARFVRQRRAAPLRQPEQAIVELPLERWVDQRGSKLRWSDFVIVGADLATIWWTELRDTPHPSSWAGPPEAS